jgi:hypothetical protein
VGLIGEKTRGRKSCATVSLIMVTYRYCNIVLDAFPRSTGDHMAQKFLRKI